MVRDHILEVLLCADDLEGWRVRQQRMAPRAPRPHHQAHVGECRLPECLHTVRVTLVTALAFVAVLVFFVVADVVTRAPALLLPTGP